MLVHSDGSVTQNPGFWKCLGKMGLRQVKQGFSSFFFVTFDDFSKESILKVMQNFERSPEMLKIWHQMKKNHVQLAFNNTFSDFLGTRKSDFGYPIHHYLLVLRQLVFHFKLLFSRYITGKEEEKKDKNREFRGLTSGPWKCKSK